jgi:autotransporter translocation and assembly factor TamB
MARAMRYVLYGLLILVGLIVLVVGLVLTPPVQTYIAKRVLNGVNRNLTGSISFVRVHATVNGDLTMSGLSLTDSAGHPLVTLDRLKISVNPLALRRNRISVRHLTMDQLSVALEFDSTGTNVQRALAPRHPSPTAPPSASGKPNPWRIRIADAQIHGAKTTLSKSDTLLFATNTWEFKGDARLVRDSLRYAIGLEIPERLVLNTDGTVYLGNPMTPLIGHLSLAADTSIMELLPSPADAVGAANLTLSFVSASDSLKLNADVRGSKLGHVTFHGATVFPVKGLAMRGEMTFDSLTPGMLWADTTNMLLNGSLTFNKIAAESPLDGWDAVVELSSSHYGRYRLTSADFKLKTRDSTATLTGDMETAGGRAQVETVVRGFLPADPDITTTITMDRIDLHQFIPQFPDSLLPLSGTIKAHMNTRSAAIDLNTITASLNTELGPVTLGSYSMDSLIVLGSLDGKSFRLDTLRVLRDSIRLGFSASGKIDGDLQYALAATIPDLKDLKRVLPKALPIPDTLGGSVTVALSGTASLARQQFSHLTASGKLSVENGVYGTDSVQSAEVRLSKFDLDSTAVNADITVRQLRAEGQTADSILLGVNGTPKDVTANVHAWARGDTLALAGAFRLQRSSEKTDLTIDSLSGHYLDLTFATEGENSLSLADNRLEIAGLTITSNVGILRAQGTVQRGGKEDFVLELSGLQTEKLAKLFKLPPTQGTVNLRLQVLGPDSDLTGEVSLYADSVSLDKQPIADQFTLNATATKRNTIVSGQLNWLGDTTLLFSAELPAQVSIDKGLTISKSSAISGHLRILEQRMEKFNRYLTGDLKLGGLLSADMTLGGTLSRPDWTGTFGIQQGSYSDPRNGVRYKDITISGNLVGDTLRIPHFDLKSGGKLTGTGWAVMAVPLPEELHLDLNFDKFQALNSPDMRITMSGPLTVNGPFNQLNGTGNITVDQALYRLTQSTTKQIEPIDVKVEIARLGGDTTKPAFSPSKIYESMSHRLHVLLPGDTWIKGSGMNVELSGDLEIDKQHNQSPEIAGEIDINRGTVTFIGHEFQVEQGQSFIRFNGPPDNPELDITATDPRLADRGVDVSVRVFGTLRQMRLSLAGTSGGGQDTLTPAAIAQLLAGVSLPGERLPGQDTTSSSSGSKIESFTTGAATGQLTGLLGSAAGLDVLRFNPGGQGGVNGLTSGSLEVGSYVTSRLFIQVIQPVQADIAAEQVSVEYRLFRWLNLRVQQIGAGESAFDLLTRIDWR